MDDPLSLLWAVPSIVILGVAYAVSRRIGEPGRHGSKVVLRAADRGLNLFYVFLCPFLSGMYLAFKTGSLEGDSQWVVPCVVIVISLLFAAAGIHHVMHTVILDEIGIKVRGLRVDHPSEIEWVNVFRIVRRYSAEYGIENTLGQCIYIQAKMDGFPLFVEECKKRLRPEVLGDFFKEPAESPEVPLPDLEGFRDARPPEL